MTAPAPIQSDNGTGGDPDTSAGTPVNVVIVDDDREIRQLLTGFLKGHGYAVTAVTDGRALLDALAKQTTDIVILDIMLPGADGLELCRTIRASSSVPIIMLTSRREETERIVGLEMGADDYVAKPFNPRELLARMKAVLRRTATPPGSIRPRSNRMATFEGWRLDTLRRELSNPAGVVVDLSGGEYDLLMAFIEAPQRVLSRDALLELGRNRVGTGFDRSIDTQVSRLRRKLGSDDGEGFIKTVRGAGYMFLPDVSRS
jgi:two-component system OmpR family response regulator